MSDRSTRSVVEALEERRLMSYTVTNLFPLWGTGGAGLEGGDKHSPDINKLGNIAGTGLKTNGIYDHASLRLISKGKVKWIDVGNFNAKETSEGNAINDANMVVGDYQLGSATDHAFIARFNKKGSIYLTPLGDFKGLNGSTAYAINNKAQVVGSAGMGTGSEQAVMWQVNKKGSYVPTKLPRLGKGFGIPGMEAMSTAADVNENGLVAGMAVDDNLQQRAAVWVAGKKGYGVVGLPGLGGSAMGTINTGFARAVNDTNFVVGEALNGKMKSQAVAWVPGKGGKFSLKPLSNPKGSAGDASANAVNNKGLIVGKAEFGSDEHATMWVPGKKGSYTPVDLNGYVKNTGWVLKQATSVNDNGVIVGTGTFNGGTATWMLTPKGVSQLSTPAAPAVAAAPQAPAPASVAASKLSLFSDRAIGESVLA
jgi:hypothetical protein